MKFIKIIIFLKVLVVSQTSFAKFESEQELFEAFNSIGVNIVVEVTDVNSSKNLLVHKTTENTTKHVDQFSEAVPMKTLDYKEKGFVKDTNYKAFAIAEIVLCYTSDNHAPSRSMYVGKNNFEKCYMLPNKIKDVVSKINSL